MARVLQPLGSVSASGSVGGVTFQRHRGGTVAHRKQRPHNSGTPKQTSQNNVLQQAHAMVRALAVTGSYRWYEENAHLVPSGSKGY